MQEDDYRREFTDALRDFVDMNQFKYAIFTDMIYEELLTELMTAILDNTYDNDERDPMRRCLQKQFQWDL